MPHGHEKHDTFSHSPHSPPVQQPRNHLHSVRLQSVPGLLTISTVRPLWSCPGLRTSTYRYKKWEKYCSKLDLKMVNVSKCFISICCRNHCEVILCLHYVNVTLYGLQMQECVRRNSCEKGIIATTMMSAFIVTHVHIIL